MGIVFEAAGSGKPQKVKLADIKQVLKKEESKHGKKSADYQLIGELGKLGLSDIAIYAGMYLARRKQKPYWTLDELKDQLTRRDFVDEKLRPMLDKTWKGFRGMTEQRKKEKALEVALSVIENESETIRTVNEHIAAQGTNSTLAHQLSKGQLSKFAESLSSAVSKITRMYGADDPDVAALVESIEWDPDSDKTTSAWLNGVVKAVGGALGVAARDLKEMKKGAESEKRAAAVNSAMKSVESSRAELDEYDKMGILWPESDAPIKGVAGVASYVRKLESQRAAAMEIIGQYERRKDAILDLASSDADEDAALAGAKWSAEKVATLVSRMARRWANDEGGARAYDDAERASAAQALAKEALRRRGLAEFLSKDHPDPEGELAGMFGARLSSPDLLKGRPEGAVEGGE